MMSACSITRLTPEMSAQFAEAPSGKHRHDYEEIIIITKGQPAHFIDFKKQTVHSPAVIYVAQGKVHEFLPDLQTQGWVIRYQTEFIPPSRFHFYSNFLDNINYPLKQEGCVEKFDTLCSLMEDESMQSPPDYGVIRHLLMALLSKLEAEGGERFGGHGIPGSNQLVTFNHFLQVLEQNFKRPEGVEFYAGKMNMTARNLNGVCQRVFARSVSEIIETRKLIEARRLLINTQLSVSEIGYELGYREKSYFTRVFGKKVGITPTGFRKKMSALFS